MRKWLEANHRRQIDDGSMLALYHWSEDTLGQPYDRFNIQLYLRDFLVERCSDKVSRNSDPGVVNQQLYFPQFVRTS